MQAGKDLGCVGNDVGATAMMTDLYQVTMAYAEWKAKR